MAAFSGASISRFRSAHVLVFGDVMLDPKSPVMRRYGDTVVATLATAARCAAEWRSGGSRIGFTNGFVAFEADTPAELITVLSPEGQSTTRTITRMHQRG